MDLPKNEKSFSFSHVGSTTGKKYEGTFTVKCVLNLADKRRLELEKSNLSADLSNPTDNLSVLSTIVSNLRVRVINSPDWFKQSIQTLDIIDDDILFEVYKAALDKSDEWFDEVKKQSLGESQGNL